MNNTELLTVVISITALFASFSALYLQFFHKRTAILGKLLDICYDHIDDNYDRAYNYSMSNIGNQEVLLNDIEFLEGQSAKGREHDAYSVHKYMCEDSPYVLKPGEIKMFKVFTKIKKSKRKSTAKQKFYIMFVLTSTEGKTFEILHDITKSNSINSDEEKATWKPFTLKNATK